MPRRQIDNEIAIKESKENIMNSALILFSLYGYKTVNIDSIAKNAGCSRGLIYHYFVDKENLYKEMMIVVANKIYELTEQIDYSLPADVALSKLLDLLLEKLSNSSTESLHTNYACMFYHILNLHLQTDVVPKPKTKSEDRPLNRKRLYQIISYLIEKGQKEKVFYDGEIKAYTISILAMLKGLSFTKIHVKENFTAPTVKMVMNIVRKGGEA